jgi:uncharacterized protein (TIGR03089 family)
VTFTTSHLPRCLHVAVSSDATRPRLTYYDDASGERVELSAHTLAGWVIKTANLLIDDVGVEPGARVSLHMPLHWLTAVWLIAADAVGATIDSPGHEPADASQPWGSVHVESDVGFEHFAVSLAPMAMPLGPALPDGTRDFCADVRTMPDQAIQPLNESSQLSEAAATRARALELAPHARVAQFAGRDHAAVADLVDGVVAPLAVDGSAVWTRHADVERWATRWGAEQVTAVIGPVPTGLVVPPQIPHLGPRTY